MKFSQYFLNMKLMSVGSNSQTKQKRLGCESLVPRPLCRQKSTLMTKPLVNSALAQFMYKKLPCPETISCEEFDHQKEFTHVLQPLSINYFAKTLSSTIFLLHVRVWFPFDVFRINFPTFNFSTFAKALMAAILKFIMRRKDAQWKTRESP